MPLYQGYRKHLKSNLADMRNTGAGGRCVGVGIVAG
jgi:leucyl aminopeptidase